MASKDNKQIAMKVVQNQYQQRVAHKTVKVHTRERNQWGQNIFYQWKVSKRVKVTVLTRT